MVDVPWGGGELDAGAALVPAELSLWCAFESACVGEYTETLGIGGLVLDAAQGLSVSLSTLQWAPGFD